MKTTSGRIFLTVALVLLAALISLGFALRSMVKDYLTESSFDRLKHDAALVSQLATSYYTEGDLNAMEFLMSLDVASKSSQSDAVICNARGKILLCSAEPLGCKHQGLYVGSDYVADVIRKGSLRDTGVISGLYNDQRYIYSVPIRNGGGNLLTHTKLFDVYQGAQIEAGKKSVAYSLKFRVPDRTLSDEDIDPILTKIFAKLKENDCILRS